MPRLDPDGAHAEGPVIHGSTHDGHPIAAACGLATLTELRRPGRYRRRHRPGSLRRQSGLDGQVVGEPVVFGLVCARRDADRARHRRFEAALAALAGR